MIFFRKQDARFAGAAMAAAVGIVALSGMAASRPADAQSGGGQDYRIWDDKRFDRRDEDFLEFQRKQRQDLGPGYSDSPEYRQDLQRFDEQRADRNATGSIDPAPVQERGTAAPR